MTKNEVIKKSSIVFVLALTVGLFSISIPVKAAPNDVTFSNDTLINISDLGINLTIVSGSNVASFVVNTGSIDFNMEDGSSVSILSADRRALDNSKVSTRCYSTFSYVSFASNATETITVTPSASIASCYSYTGGGGGQAVTPTPTPTPTTTTSVTPTTTPTTAPTPTVAVTTLAPVTIPALPSKPTNTDVENVLTALTQQIAYIQAHITAPNVLMLMGEVVARLSGLQTAISGVQASVVPAAGSYLVPLSFGVRGEGVTALQNFLATREPDVYPKGLVTGYFGPLTEKAIEKFQEKYNIADSGDPGYGFVGPKTRAKINEFLGL